jgi:hypothetical protein
MPLSLKQHPLQSDHGGMREPAHPVPKVLAAGGAIPRRKRNRTRESGDTYLPSAPGATGNQDSGVPWTHRHPPDHPPQTQERLGILLQTFGTRGMPANPVVRCNGDETRPCEAVAVLILPVNWNPFGERHTSKSLDRDPRPVAHSLQEPGIGTTPPVGVPSAVVDAEGFIGQDMYREVQTARESQEPGEQRLIGKRIDIEREFAYRRRSEARRFRCIKRLRLQHGAAARAEW